MVAVYNTRKEAVKPMPTRQEAIEAGEYDEWLARFEMECDDDTERTADYIDYEIGQQMARIRDMVEKKNDLDYYIREARARVEELLEEKGDNWTDPKGYARIVPEQKRAAFDLKALDALIATYPKRYGILLKHRKETTISRYVQVS